VKYRVYESIYSSGYPDKLFNSLVEGYFSGDKFVAKGFEEYFINSCSVKKTSTFKRPTDNWKKTISNSKWLRCVEDENCFVINSLAEIYYNPKTGFIYRIIKNCNNEKIYVSVNLRKVSMLKDSGIAEYYDKLVEDYYDEKMKIAAMNSCHSKEGDSKLFEDLKESLEECVEIKKERDKDEYTGGSVNYYKLRVDNPTTSTKPYEAECNDIIEALGMNYAEGNAFKAIWRKCAARKFGIKKKGYDSGLYDSEKVVFFGERMVQQSKQEEK